MKIVFAGTPQEAAIILQAMLGICDVPFVITQPDRPAGRGKQMQKSPVALLSQQENITLRQPEKIEKIKGEIRAENPDILLVVAYGQKIPMNVLKIPKYGCVNIHFSLLPRYRGASPVQEAILRGASKTGYTIMLMNERIDEGAILEQGEVTINTDDTTATLKAKIAFAAAKNIVRALRDFIVGRIKPKAQSEAGVSLCRKIKKEDALIAWERESAEEIAQKVHAFFPWPGTFTFWNSKRLKILNAQIAEQKNSSGLMPGTPFVDDTGKLFIATQKGILELLTVQLEGRKPLNCKEFLRGQGQNVPSVLTSKAA